MNSDDYGLDRNGGPYHIGKCPECGCTTGDNFNYPCDDCRLVMCPSCEEYYKNSVMEASGLCPDCDKYAAELEQVNTPSVPERIKFSIDMYEHRRELIELVTK